MKELVWLTFAFLCTLCMPSRAETATYSWGAVTERVNGEQIDGQLSYELRHNGQVTSTPETTVTVEGYPEAGRESCVRAVEVHPDGLTLQSAWNCIIIKARPQMPDFRIIQLIE